MKTKLHYLLTALFILFLFTGNSYSEPRRVLLEFVTGTWCQWCPCGDDAAEQILTAYPNTIVLAYHGAGSDPWQNFTGSSVRSMLGFAAYPTGIIDRMNHPGNPGQGYAYVTYDQWYSKVTDRYNSSANSPISLVLVSKNYNSSNGELTASVNATALQNLTGQYKLCFVVTESNVVYPQTGNGTCAGSSTYIHKWIVRTMANGETGENINTGAWNQNQVINKTLTTTLSNQWVASNCDLVVFAFRDSSSLYFAETQQALKTPVTSVTGISTGTEIPADYSLSQNYPNPFNPSTHIKFSVPKDGNASLKIFDVTGKLAAVYLDGFIKAGTYNAEIDGSGLASGVYFYRLEASGFTKTMKMTLIK